jgi:tripartite-type tricarboxylate transporter receptor subunit TctC
MSKAYGAAATVLAFLTALGSSVVSGETYPSRPVRIVTSDPGAGNDFIARVVAQRLTTSLGRQVIVENRPAGVIPGEIVAKARPDAHTLLLYGNNLWIGSLLHKTPYDPARDFAPIALISRAPNVLVVHPSLPVSSVKELIDLAKAKPGALNYASGSIGSSSHLAAELFKHMAGVSIAWIPYKGGAAMQAIIAGEVQLSFGTAAAVAPHTKSGKLKALAVTSAQPSALLPGLPTIAAAGLPGYESVAFYGLFAPAKTPAALIERLNREVALLLDDAEVKGKLFNAGTEAVGGTPQDFAAAIKSDTARVGRMIKVAGIRVD